MTKPFLPIKHFQIWENAIYVLDANGRVWGSDDFAKGEKWHDYTQALDFIQFPVPQCPPPTRRPK